MRREGPALVLAGLLGAAPPACGGTTEPSASGADGGADTGGDEGDGGFELGEEEAAPDAGPVVFNDVRDPKFWTFADLDGLVPQSHGGGVFDGRYVYWLAGTQASDGGFADVLVRYDTQRSFIAPSSWTVSMDLGRIAPTTGLFDLGFDGRYMYASPGSGAQALRYDTQQALDDPGAWEASTSLPAMMPGGENYGAVGGVAIAGRYVYLEDNGVVTLRYDTQGAFGDASSWSAFDVGTIASKKLSTWPCTTGSRFLVLTPVLDAPLDVVIAYDTNQPFGAGSSWKTFGLDALGAQVGAYRGAGSDGRYVYFVPHEHQFADAGGVLQPHGLVARWDTTASLDGPSSWSLFDTRQLHPDAHGFTDAMFDGRYFYFLSGTDFNAIGGGLGDTVIVTRVDTTVDFSSPSSWSFVDARKLNALGYAVWGEGVAFDGEYIYFAPTLSVSGKSTIAARFDARTPPKMPASMPGGSFY